jgi:hypothetical protein
MGEAMRSLWTGVAILTAAIAINGCKHRKEEPLPGPRAATAAQAPGAAATGPASRASREHPTGASGISWFQGTIEEAFSKAGTKGRVGKVSFRY